MSSSGNAERLERQARRRAGLKLGWLIHALAYAIVNLGLWAAAVAGDRYGAVYPSVGWGFGLLVHGLVVYLFLGGIYERFVQREQARLGRK
jgi:hypothetical protein